MKISRNSGRLKLIRTAVLLVWVTASLPSFGRAQQSTMPKKVVVFHWYDKDFPFNAQFDQSFQAALQSAPAGTVDYYAEYLDTRRFPGGNQSQLLRDYLQKKYADRTMDAVVANSDTSMEFLLKYRADLFPNTPIVFIAAREPTAQELAAGAGVTGIINLRTHKKNVDLALRLHPGTEQVFVVTGTMARDRKFETLARRELQGYESRVKITYLTDLRPDELTARMQSLPKGSVVLYVWQQSRNERGEILESAFFADLIARSASVPVYTMIAASVAHGFVGGHVTAAETIATRAAEIALRIANGERADDIPVENAPTFPMFDWRQLQRWKISEEKLPSGSVILFKEPGFWGQYKWYILGVLAVCVLEGLLIVGLLVQRARRARAEEARRLSEEKFSKAFHSSPDAFVLVRRCDGAIIEVNDRWEALLGYQQEEVAGRSLRDLGVYRDPEDSTKFLKLIEEFGFVRDLEHDVRSKSGSIHQVIVAAESMTIHDEPCLLLIIHDITERIRSERKLRELTGRLIHLQDEERRRIAAELHDSLGQSLAIISNRAKIWLRDASGPGCLREQVEKISATAASAIAEVREIAHNLRPFELEHLGLAAAVESMVEKVSGATSLRLSADLDRIDGLLTPAAETDIYRIVQEGLNNVVKHAEATEACIGIKRTERELVVSVWDNGRGLKPRGEGEIGTNNGFGLAGIAERTRMLGGAWTIDSAPGQGTTITVRLALSAP